MTKDIQLFDYQEDMVKRVQEAFRHHDSVMVQMPTGTGKTMVLANIVFSFLEKSNHPIWIVAHRRELVSQIKETIFSKITPSLFTLKEGSTAFPKPLSPQGTGDVTALRCSEPLRYKVGGASKPCAMLCGMGPPSYYLAKGAGYYPYFRTTLSCNKSQRERNVFNV